MPNQGHDKRTFRMADEPWKRFAAACETADVDPHVMLRTLVLWYSRTPGVTVRRPPERSSSD